MNSAFSRIARRIIACVAIASQRVTGTILGHLLGQQKSNDGNGLRSFVPLSHCPKPPARPLVKAMRRAATIGEAVSRLAISLRNRGRRGAVILAKRTQSVKRQNKQ
jgi:hypothetical protein